jgi:hypothetical protein
LSGGGNTEDISEEAARGGVVSRWLSGICKALLVVSREFSRIDIKMDWMSRDHLSI